LPRFVLIDQSIIDIGGHHYEYAQHVLAAAARAAYEPVLVTNRRARGDDAPWPVVRAYRYGIWFRLAPPGWLRPLWDGAATIGRWKSLVRLRLMFSPFGVLWAARDNLEEFFQRLPLSGGTRSVWIALAAVWFATVIAAVFRLVAAMLPLRGYFSRVGPPVNVVVRALLSPLGLFLGWHPERMRWVYDRYRMRQFARDTRAVFRQVPLAAGDVVFLPTVTFVETAGLLRYLESDPASRCASWHLLFRRALYAGLEGDYAGQDEEMRVHRHALLECRRRALGDHVRFYTDTDRLTDQYNRLGLVAYHTLPIPHTQPAPPSPPARMPLTAVYLGDARKEKGFHHLPRVIRDLWRDYVERDRLRFRLQVNYNTADGDPEAVVARADLSSLDPRFVEMIDRPLSSQEYRELLAGADIALLPYDRFAYYSRSSGVLVEAMATGVPVVVPAASWLSAQVAGEITRYRRALPETRATYYRRAPVFSWRRSGNVAQVRGHLQLRIGGEATKVYTSIIVPIDATLMVVTGTLDQNGTYAQLYVDHLDAHGESLHRQVLMMERSGDDPMASAAVRLRAGTHSVWVSLRNAFGDAMIAFSGVRVDFYAEPPDAPIPLGVIAAVCHNAEEISGAVRELVDHHAHYRETSHAFAGHVYATHNADALIADLVPSWERLLRRSESTIAAPVTGTATGHGDPR